MDHYVDESDVPQTPPHSSRTSAIIIAFASPRVSATIIITADVGYPQTCGGRPRAKLGLAQELFALAAADRLHRLADPAAMLEF